MYIAHPWSYFWLAIEPFPFFSMHCWSSVVIKYKQNFYKLISTSTGSLAVFFIRPTLCMFILSDLLSPEVSWSWFCRRHVGPSTGPGCSSYGPGTAGDELVHRWTWRWYRVVQSGTERYSSRWWVVVIRWDPSTSPHYCQQELSNKLWTSPYLRLKRVSMILLWYP